MEALRKHHISFKHAIDGIIWAFSTQPNFRVHFVLATSALLLGVFLQITNIEMIIIILTIVVGLAVEMVNTSLESMTDLITSEYRESAKIAKDVAAGMMLLTAMGACLVAGFIFIPRILSVFHL